ncbi:hypothetical protein EV202_11533 [Bacteroides heparinolyticus]|uniref:Uncharacterized protein n=1 Tax=Prevotella heparinolytica TaxID=28113 RepID=A0A4R2LNZ3_9BACE|nr:hypothetical protein EV202_11533 [Bacteroides heparinolyticus]
MKSFVCKSIYINLNIYKYLFLILNKNVSLFVGIRTVETGRFIPLPIMTLNIDNRGEAYEE